MHFLKAESSEEAKEMKSGNGKVAIYARVSTTHTRQSPAMQLEELREYGKARGWKV
jgi:predicted site-specific integrase-resolvase